MIKRFGLAVAALGLMVAMARTTRAGTITSYGNVTALTHIDQIGQITGTADFDDGPANAKVSLTAYSSEGLTFHAGDLSSILPGVTASGSAFSPSYGGNASTFFPGPIGGGGSQSGLHEFYGGAVTFSGNVTQFGLTFSYNGNQHITAWDTDGKLIGQVNWDPSGDSSFVGIDTRGVRIGLLTVGNDDVWNGDTYSQYGLVTHSDTWVWNDSQISAVPEPTTLASGILGVVLGGGWWLRRRKARATA